MKRRKLAAAAGALSVTAFATTVGLGANFGLFGLTQPESPVGRLDSANTATANPASGGVDPVAVRRVVPTTVALPRDADD